MITEGSRVRRIKDGPDGAIGRVSSKAAVIASLFMAPPEPDDNTVFVVWRGDDLGWYDAKELVEVSEQDDC